MKTFQSVLLLVAALTSGVHGEVSTLRGHISNELVAQDDQFYSTVSSKPTDFCVTQKKCPSGRKAVKDKSGNVLALKGWNFCARPVECPPGSTFGFEYDPDGVFMKVALTCKTSAGSSMFGMCFPGNVQPCETKPCRKAWKSYCGREKVEVYPSFVEFMDSLDLKGKCAETWPM